MSETVALNKKRQSKFAKKAAKVKSKVQKGEIKVKENATPDEQKKWKSQHGLIYVGHIPHGFYEKEMLSYFSQFGKITKVRVCRSYKTGKSKGYGFVGFELPEVAEVAAQTMDNYLMFKRRLEVKYIPPEKQQHNVFKGTNWSENRTSRKGAINRATRQRNKNYSEEIHIKKAKQQISKLKKTMKKLNELGISHEFQPNDVPVEVTITSLNEEKTTKSKIGKAKKPVPKKVALKSGSSSVDKAPKQKVINGKEVSVPKKRIEPISAVSVDELLKEMKKVKGKLTNLKKAKELKKRKPEMKKNVQKSDSEQDESFNEVPKKKKIMQKNLAIAKSKKAPVKKMSDKLKKATMGILNSDLVAKTAKVPKKVDKKKK